MNAQTLPPSASHFIGMMNMHYAAADFLSSEYERTGCKNRKLLADAGAALEFAEAARLHARELGAKV